MTMIVANWKMNLSCASAAELASNLLKLDLGSCDLIICPPFTMLERIGNIIKSSFIKLGGQDCTFTQNGSYTGDISAEMLKSCGCEFVILGHSERRQHHNESNELIKQKAMAAHDSQLKTIICIGESALERNEGLTLQIIKEQLLYCIPKTEEFKNFSPQNLIIAYEPVWAIGSGAAPTSGQISEVALFVRDFLAKRFPFETPPLILYGGSVTPHNARAIANIDCVDGLLIGKASLIIENFGEIIRNICKMY